MISIGINIVITMGEIVVGLLIGSLAIISDAVHNFFEVGAMVMSLLGEKVNRKVVASIFLLTGIYYLQILVLGFLK